MTKRDGTPHWSQAGGSFRPSAMLRSGAAVVLLGALMHLVGRVMPPAEFGLPPVFMLTGWTAFIVGILLWAGAFIWVGVHPILSTFGWWVGLITGAQGTLLLISLITGEATPVPLPFLSFLRLGSTATFALVEQKSLRSPTAPLLVAASGVQMVKILMRAAGWIPDLGIVGGAVVDTVFLAFLAAALFQLGTRLRGMEDDWAVRTVKESGVDFRTFNNPEHEWNRKRKGKKAV